MALLRDSDAQKKSSSKSAKFFIKLSFKQLKISSFSHQYGLHGGADWLSRSKC